MKKIILTVLLAALLITPATAADTVYLLTAERGLDVHKMRIAVFPDLDLCVAIITDLKGGGSNMNLHCEPVTIEEADRFVRSGTADEGR